MNDLFCVVTDKVFVSARSFCLFFTQQSGWSRVSSLWSHMSVTGMQYLTSICQLSSLNNPLWIYVITTPIGSISYPSLFHLTHCRCRGLLLYLIALSDTHSLGVLWTTDQPDPETSFWQHTTITTGGIRIRNPSKGPAANPHHRPRGYRD
jgi:hypothetical protein